MLCPQVPQSGRGSSGSPTAPAPLWLPRRREPTMNLADALAQSKKAPGTACAIGLLLADLPVEDAETLRLALSQTTAVMPHAQIIRALGLMGHKVTSNSVGRHRAGDCRCES